MALNYVRGAGGKFAGSKGGFPGGHVGGGQTLGGSRGVVARTRLRMALGKLREARMGAQDVSGKREARHAATILRRKLRNVALHRREVARVEKHGGLSLKGAGNRRSSLKISKGELKGVRQDRVFFAREKISALRQKIRGDSFVQKSQLKNSNPAAAGIARRDRKAYAKALLGARRALRNRKRELARLGRT